MVAPPVAFSPDVLRKLAELEAVVGASIRGKAEVIRLSLVCLLARGHLLIEDVPGVGKTTLAQALARAANCRFHRLQFTSDMLPSDVLGVTIYNAHAEGLRVHARSDLQQLPAGRRDQPHHAEDPVGAAGSDEREPGHHRRQIARPAAALHGDRHAEPGRASRHVPAPRIAARPLPDAAPHRLPRRSQRTRDPAQRRARTDRRPSSRPGGRRHPALAGRSSPGHRGRGHRGLHARDRGAHAQPRIAGARRQSARQPGAVPRVAGAGAGRRPRLRDPRRREASSRTRSSRTA